MTRNDAKMKLFSASSRETSGPVVRHWRIAKAMRNPVKMPTPHSQSGPRYKCNPKIDGVTGCRSDCQKSFFIEYRLNALTELYGYPSRPCAYAAYNHWSTCSEFLKKSSTIAMG